MLENRMVASTKHGPYACPIHVAGMSSYPRYGRRTTKSSNFLRRLVNHFGGEQVESTYCAKSLVTFFSHSSGLNTTTSRGTRLLAYTFMGMGKDKTEATYACVRTCTPSVSTFNSMIGVLIYPVFLILPTFGIGCVMFLNLEGKMLKILSRARLYP